MIEDNAMEFHMKEVWIAEGRNRAFLIEKKKERKTKQASKKHWEKLNMSNHREKTREQLKR